MHSPHVVVRHYRYNQILLSTLHQSKIKLLRVCKQNPIFACLPIHDMSLIFTAAALLSASGASSASNINLLCWSCHKLVVLRGHSAFYLDHTFSPMSLGWRNLFSSSQSDHQENTTRCRITRLVNSTSSTNQPPSAGVFLLYSRA